METNFTKIYNWNKLFGFILPDTLQSQIYDENPNLVKFRISLIKEECNELYAAINDNDTCEIFDAICDILVTAYGMGASFGINLDYVIRNMLTNHHINSQQTINLDDLLKYIEINETIYNLIKNNSRTTIITHEINYIVDKIKIHFDQMVESIENKQMTLNIFYLSMLIISVYELGIIYEFDVDYGVELVNQSNTNKSCVTEQEAIDSVEYYKKMFESEVITNLPRYDTPCYKLAPDNNRYLIYNKSTGKILKSINWKPVNFNEILNYQ